MGIIKGVSRLSGINWKGKVQGKIWTNCYSKNQNAKEKNYGTRRVLQENEIVHNQACVCRDVGSWCIIWLHSSYQNDTWQQSFAKEEWILSCHSLHEWGSWPDNLNCEYNPEGFEVR